MAEEPEEPLFVRYLDTEPIEVDPTGCKTVASFIEKIKAKFGRKLESYELCDLTLYDHCRAKLKGDQNIPALIKSDDFINNYDHPLLIKDCDTIQPTAKKPKKIHQSEDRKNRWEKLNVILRQAEKAAAEKKKKRPIIVKKSSAYPSVKWNMISSLYEPIMEDYTQAVKEIPLDKMDLLHTYTKSLAKCLGPVMRGKESQRLHFITPILVFVCDLFGPQDDVRIVIEEDLNGYDVKANGHFEYMLKRKNKIICIVEAKKDDLDQGRAQDLVGMEVASEVDSLDIVYGIVTNYVEWFFLKSKNDKVEQDYDTLTFESGVVTFDTLKRVAGKIFDMLSD